MSDTPDVSQSHSIQQAARAFLKSTDALLKSTGAFLKSIGAEALPGGGCRFPDEPRDLSILDGGTARIPLSGYGLLSVTGPDAEKFLQGQLTCSAADVTVERSSPGAHCTPKGRIISSFQLLRPAPDRFLLRLRADLLETAAQALGKYIVFSKARLQPREDLVGIGLHGPDAGAIVRALAGASPGARHATVICGDGFVLQRDDGGNWFECWLPAADALQLWEKNPCARAGSRYWEWLNIRAGIAEIGAATSDEYIPQMLNYHLTGAVNFQKGCYTGQEIVARAYYRGQVKRHLIRAQLSGNVPATGDAVSDAAGKTVGTVFGGVEVAPGQAELLAVCSTTAGDSAATLHIGAAELRPAPLPYAIP